MKNKKVIIIILATIIIISLGTYLVISNNKDSVKFKNEYEAYNNLTYKENNKQNKYENLDINKNNPILYLTDETVLKIKAGENKIIFLGTPEDNNTRLAVKTLLETAEDNGIDKIYYYEMNPKENEKRIYKKLKEITKQKDLTTPYLALIKDSKTENSQNGLTDDLYKKYEEIMIDYLMCTSNC